MEILDLDGTAYERGYEQGERMREQYHEMLHAFFTSEVWLDNKPGIIPNAVIKWIIGHWGVNRTRKALARRLPAQTARVEGIADGLGIGRRFTWGVQYLELMFCEAGKSIKAPASMGCTQIHAQPRATAHGRPLTARNYDFPNLLAPYQVVRRDIPAEPDRLAATTVTQVALVGCHQGINEAGLMVALNNARLWKGQGINLFGVPYMLIILEILETCRTTAQAAEFMINFPLRGNAGFLGLMDAEGDCCVVEFTDSRTAVRRPGPEGVMAQANHFIQMPDANLPEGSYWTVKGMEGLEYAESTRKRYEAADRLIRQAAGGVTIETMQSILSDHSANNGGGNDNTVCAHGHSGGTLSSMVFDVAERRMHIADGHPCESEYSAVEFRGRG